MATIITKKGRYYIQYWVLGARKTVSTKLEISEENLEKVQLMKDTISEKVEVKRKDLKFRDILKTVENKNSINTDLQWQ